MTYLAVATPMSFAGPAPLGALSMPLMEGDAGTAQTVDQIRQLVDQGSKDPLVNRTALAIVQRVRPFDFAGEARAIFEFARTLRFTRDMTGRETLRTAREILTVRAGDCDDVNAILIPSLLMTIGHRVRLVTISSHPQAPNQFSHIYAEVYLGRRWVPLDVARRDPAFGRGPARFYRKRIWSLNGGQYIDVRGLGYYAPARGMGFDWGDFGEAVGKITGGVGTVIGAIRAPASYLGPAVAPAPAAAAAVAPPVAPGWTGSLPWLFGGFLLVMLLRGGAGR